MKSQRKFHTLPLVSTILILFLILVLSTASAATVQDSSVTLNETQISYSGYAYSPASIYQDKIVWTDARNGTRDIYMYDISTSKETQITTNVSSEPTMERPCIHSNKIIWIDDRSRNREIYMYDLSTNQETRITTSSGWKFYPAIYGDRIAWAEYRINNNDIFMYDISTSKETQITTNGSGQYYPDIYGDKIVWVDERNGNEDIYMYDISTSKEIQITNNKSDQTNPAIYGNRIVWIDYRSGDSDLYLYDISTNHETQVANITIPYKGVYGLAIYGDLIVWGDYRNGNWDIYMHDLSTSKETQITTNSYTQSSPDIYEDRIVWMENQNGYIYNIYMCTISDKLELLIPVANFSTNVSSGFAPLSVQFNDSSENATSWNWDFGDGTNSTDQNTTHTYSEAGIYNVNLTVINANGTDSKLAVITVFEQPILPVANFSTNITSGYAPLAVQFNDSSENATGLNWDFENDGNTDSTEANPVYIYSVPGIYTVNLTATNQNGTNSKLATITVLEQTLPPVANFTSNVTQGYTPLTVQFTDSSENATEWKWDFGDRTYSTDKDPVHTYGKAGRYTVSLTVKNANGMDAEIKSKYISVANSKGKKA